MAGDSEIASERFDPRSAPDLLEVDFESDLVDQSDWASMAVSPE